MINLPNSALFLLLLFSLNKQREKVQKRIDCNNKSIMNFEQQQNAPQFHLALWMMASAEKKSSTEVVVCVRKHTMRKSFTKKRKVYISISRQWFGVCSCVFVLVQVNLLRTVIVVFAVLFLIWNFTMIYMIENLNYILPYHTNYCVNNSSIANSILRKEIEAMRKRTKQT